jgi:holo-[acyl-carrier protein] synthase
MIVGIGTDLIEVSRVKKMIENHPDLALQKIFTQIEIDYCNGFNQRKYEHFAARFAVKEAFSKAIGTGFGDSFVLKDVGVENLKSGQPIINLTGKLRKKYGKYKLHLTIAHTIDYATATVIIEDNSD